LPMPTQFAPNTSWRSTRRSAEISAMQA
jgi:hypothetical protein